MKVLLAFTLLWASSAYSQETRGEILGAVQDGSGAAVGGAAVRIRSLDTNAATEAVSSDAGRFRFPQLPAGNYELTVEKAGFARFVQGPIVLRLNQDADITVKLQVAGVTETVTVSSDAPLLNTTNAEVGVNFDTKRISELPLAPNRNLYNLAFSVAGVSQTSSGQSGFAGNGNNGTEANTGFSVNGMRLRSNNFMIDGQDANDPSVGGLQTPLNNPDIVSEIRLITNQFAPEFGRAAGSVVNIVTKSGTNKFHGSAFWYNNNNKLNSRSNLDKAAGFTSAPFRTENQFGGTLGGPVIKDKTFFFGSLQRWTDRRLGSGSTINGAPTEEGRRALSDLAGSQATVKALLENLPAATAGNGQSRAVTFNGRTATIPLGNLTGSANQSFNDWQYIAKVDHRLTNKHNIGGRFLVDDGAQTGNGQVTPSGLTSVLPQVSRNATAYFNSTLRPTIFNELRVAYSRYYTSNNADNPTVAERIPSIEVTDLGLRGFNALASRTGIGLAANLPQFGTKNNYQIQDTIGIIRGSHSMKFGIDMRRQEQFQFFFPISRGRLEYPNLQALVDDRATVAQINVPLPGAERLQYYRYYDYFFFLQDEWRVKPNLTITYGVRYESPGNMVQNLADYNERTVKAFNGDERFRYFPVPPRDNNNWAPRFGLNYKITDRLVLRTGYSRTYDLIFNNIGLNIGSAFPFLVVYDVPPDATTRLRHDAFADIATVRAGRFPGVANPNQITRTNVSPDFRSPYAEQFSFQLQRELARDYVWTFGWVGTKGTALFQTTDGNPTVPGSGGTQRVNPVYGVIRQRCNCTSSVYHSFQTSFEKRLSNNFSMAAHYTWSAFIDGASEVFNPSNSGEIAIPQDSFNRRADRGRSSYDRPHRFTVNGVYELPAFRSQKGIAGKVLGGWQANYFLTFQSGAPFSPLNGSDPGGRVLGINGLVGTSIRPNLATTLDLSNMGIREIQAAGGSNLFRTVTADAPLGNLGRNVLRADGINRLDFGLIKNTKLAETHTIQIRADFFNLTNTRNYGIPESVVTSAAFLNEGATDGGLRRIQVGLRYVF